MIGERPTPQVLLGYLAAARRDVFRQSEVLCTLGLGWILGRSPAAARRMGELYGVEGIVRWTTEWVDPHGRARELLAAELPPDGSTEAYDAPVLDAGGAMVGRVDLVGYVKDGEDPALLVEAKLGATLQSEQLQRYQSRGVPVGVLVPAARLAGDTARLRQWGISAPALSWTNLLGEFAAAIAGDDAAAADLAQLQGLLEQFDAALVEPFTANDLEHPTVRRRHFAELIQAAVSDLAVRFDMELIYGLYDRADLGNGPRRYFKPRGLEEMGLIARINEREADSAAPLICLVIWVDKPNPERERMVERLRADESVTVLEDSKRKWRLVDLKVPLGDWDECLTALAAEATRVIEIAGGQQLDSPA